jgi:hypothetical protein
MSKQTSTSVESRRSIISPKSLDRVDRVDRADRVASFHSAP